MEYKFGGDETNVEKDWLKMVRFAETKPDYGMRDLNPVLEEITVNKLEIVGPLVDGYIKEIGLSIYSKFDGSYATCCCLYAFRHTCIQAPLGFDARVWRQC